MKIDQALNLVTTIDQEDSLYPVYVFVTPFPYEVVEQFHEMLGTVLSRSYQLIGELGSVRTCAMQLRKAEKEFYPNYSGPSFFDEVERLTQVAVMKDGVWKKITLEAALKNGIISQEDWRDVEGEVSFFIVGSAMQKRKYLQSLTARALAMFGAVLTPLNFTAYLGSLPKPSEDKDSEDMDPDADAEGSKPTSSPQKRVHIPS